MNRIGKYLIFLISFLVACSSQDNALKKWIENNGKKKILATTSMVGDLVQSIGGDRIDLLTLIDGELDPHSYELVKGDDEKLQFADLIFYNGLGLEHGASLSYYLQKSKKAVPLGNYLQSKYPEKILRTEEGTIDPHVWMDIQLWSHAGEIVLEQLILLDPDGKKLFRKNFAQVEKELLDLDKETQKEFLSLDSSKRFLVTSHDAFQYFARRYLAEKEEENWKQRLSSPEGLAPEGEISPNDIKMVLAFLKKNHISVIFPESNVPQSSLQKIASDAKKMGLSVIVAKEILYGDTMPPAKEGISRYTEMHKHNAKVITEYLRKG